MPLLEVRDVSFAYGGAQVLRGLSMSVEAGEIVTLVGANGAGKTTLLNAISGINRISAGSITLDGIRTDTLDPADLPGMGIVQVPENRHVFPYLDVDANLALGAYHRSARKNMKRRRDWVFGLLPALAERRTQRAGSLSGGQQQMLVIGRALMANPRLLMLDEPSLGLAPIIVSQLFQLIRRIRDDEGTTVLLVEQNVRQALAIADRGYAIQEGRILMSGPSGEIAGSEKLTEIMLGVAEPAGFGAVAP